MAERKHVTIDLPAALVDQLDRAASERCVGRKLLIEMLLTQGLRRLTPATAFLFGDDAHDLAPDLTSPVSPIVHRPVPRGGDVCAPGDIETRLTNNPGPTTGGTT